MTLRNAERNKLTISCKFFLVAIAGAGLVGIVAFQFGVSLERESWKKALESSSKIAKKLKTDAEKGGNLTEQAESYFSGGAVSNIGSSGVSYCVGAFNKESVLLYFEEGGWSVLLPQSPN